MSVEPATQTKGGPTVSVERVPSLPAKMHALRLPKPLAVALNDIFCGSRYGHQLYLTDELRRGIIYMGMKGFCSTGAIASVLDKLQPLNATGVFRWAR